MNLVLCLLMALSFASSQVWGAKVLLLRFSSEEMNAVKSVISSDLNKHEVLDVILTKNSEFEEILADIKKVKPQIIVALDNKAVNFVKKLRYNNDQSLANIPAAATMALNLPYVLKGTKGICGIGYEVPAFTIITRFRVLSKKQITNVLAPYRNSEFETSYQEAKVQLQKIGVNLIGVDVESNGSDPAAISKMLNTVLSETYNNQEIDAILIPSDNNVLNPESFASVWLPKAQKLKIPLLCNIEKLTSKDFDFCSYAAFPDFSDLGHQLTEQILEVLENGVSPSDLGVDYIVSAKESINLSKLKAIKFPLDLNKLSNIKQSE